MSHGGQWLQDEMAWSCTYRRSFYTSSPIERASAAKRIGNISRTSMSGANLGARGANLHDVTRASSYATVRGLLHS